MRKLHSTIQLSVLVIFLTMWSGTGWGQAPWEPYMVKDLNPTLGSDAEIKNVTAVGSIVFFSAYTTVLGEELWVSDGTAEGTRLLRDIYSGVGSSDLKEFTDVNGTLFFVADDGEHGRELWLSDGTPDGTAMVEDINSGVSGSSPRNLINLDGVLYASAGTVDIGAELLRSDGTAAGTYLIDVVPYCESGICLGSHAYPLAKLNDSVVFVASRPSTTGGELWKTDGTPAGTTIIKDIYPGKGSFDSTGKLLTADRYAVVGNVIYFAATDGIQGYELWRSDGTEPGTYMVKDIKPEPGNPYANGSKPRDFAVVGNEVFFVVDDTERYGAVWKSDGTAEGTVRLETPTGEVLQAADHLTEVNGSLWFQAHDSTHGREPWISDGTVQGTRLVRDVADQSPPWNPSVTNDSFPRDFVAFGSMTVFQTVFGYWASDGTPAGTHAIDVPDSFVTRNEPLATTNGRLFFAADDGIHGLELWASAVAPGTTYMVKDINLTAGSHGALNFLTAVQDKLFFTAHSAIYREDDASFVLLSTDGTEEGTVAMNGPEISDDSGATVQANVLTMLEHEGQLVVHALVPKVGEFLFLADENGIADAPFFEGESMTDITSAGALIFFEAQVQEYSYVNGVRRVVSTRKVVFRSDGTANGTFEVASVLRSWRDETDPNTTQTATYCDSPQTRESTKKGRRVRPEFTHYDDYAYFAFCDEQTGVELWRTDGTVEGTHLVKDINPSGIDIYGRDRVFHGDPRDFEESNGILYFRAYTEDEGSELWRTDGTAEGTFLVRDIWPGIYFDYTCYCYRARSSWPNFFTHSDGNLFFSANNGDHFNSLHELWKSDGTHDGTANVRSAHVPRLRDLRELVSLGGEVYFSGWDVGVEEFGCYETVPQFGRELWRSNGTALGTDIVKDIFTEFQYEIPYVSSAYCWGSHAYPSLVADNQLLFQAIMPETGGETWRTDGTEVGTRLIADINPGPAHSGNWQVHVGDKVYGTFDDGLTGAELWAMNTYWTVGLDIKPGSDDNCVNINQHGIIPVAIMGSADVDVRKITPESLSLQGLNVRMVGKSNNFLVSFDYIDSDGFEDMLVKFEDTDQWIEPGREYATLKGRLTDQTLIKGKDYLCIVP